MILYLLSLHTHTNNSLGLKTTYQILDSAILRIFKAGLNVYSKCSSYFIRYYSFCLIRGSEVLLLMTVLVVLGREKLILKLLWLFRISLDLDYNFLGLPCTKGASTI